MDASLKRHFRQTHLNPDVGLAMLSKLVVKRLRLACRDVALKKTTGDSMRPFSTMKGCEPNSVMLGE